MFRQSTSLTSAAHHPRPQEQDALFRASVAKYRKMNHQNDAADGAASSPDAPAAVSDDLGSSDYDSAYEAALRREREADASFLRSVPLPHPSRSSFPLIPKAGPGRVARFRRIRAAAPDPKGAGLRRAAA